MSDVLAFSDVAFRYPDEPSPVLEDVSLKLHVGDKWLVKGPSGCGKSTLFYLLNGLYPDACDGELTGTRILFGKPYEQYRPGEISQVIATVFQDPDSQFCMPTVEEELAFTLENQSVPRGQMEEQITRTLEETGLTAFRHRVIQTLSGGEKQRVATACALIMKPKIVLLDEPLAHLDPMTAREYVQWFSALQQRHEWTVLVIDHQAELWRDFFDHVIELGEHVPISETKRTTPSSSKPVGSGLFKARVNVPGILNTAELQLESGTITVLAGPNGAGKSTLLKAVAGLIPSAEREVYTQSIGYVPQSPEFLFMTSSVRQEVALGGGIRTETYIDKLLLGAVAASNPFAVSQGQKRRTALAAMLNDARSVLLLDEPTAGQDAYALEELEDALFQVVTDGAALLVVTHDMNFASRIADALLLIRDGDMSGPFVPRSVFSNPALLEKYRLVASEGGSIDVNMAAPVESFY
ncbi:ABC transporter ATP-binding protein [Chryseomicrobium excrementi]|uniref:ABC transporter ATP-binding protein n=1 Tax=Chryseomicrobium excrementi TaxID=2041346 RepID=UPI0013FD32C3|nr:ABC transporter ATP-binding protein [Chryseomicrobium excrementi]